MGLSRGEGIVSGLRSAADTNYSSMKCKVIAITLPWRVGRGSGRGGFTGVPYFALVPLQLAISVGLGDRPAFKCLWIADVHCFATIAACLPLMSRRLSGPPRRIFD